MHGVGLGLSRTQGDAGKVVAEMKLVKDGYPHVDNFRMGVMEQEAKNNVTGKTEDKYNDIMQELVNHLFDMGVDMNGLTEVRVTSGGKPVWIYSNLHDLCVKLFDQTRRNLEKFRYDLGKDIVSHYEGPDVGTLTWLEENLIENLEIAKTNPVCQIDEEEINSVNKSIKVLSQSLENQQILADSFLDLSSAMKEFLKRKNSYQQEYSNLVSFEQKWQKEARHER